MIVSKKKLLLSVISIVFIANILLAELVGVKIFSLEKLMSIEGFQFDFLGISNIHLEFTTGVLIWPIVFILTDILNEYFGFKGVRFISITSVIVIIYTFLIISMAIDLPPASWWENQQFDNGDMINRNVAYNTVFGQSQWIIIGSVIAFLVAQLFDALIFKKLKKILKGKNIWLRATLSTIVSQLFDSFIVLFIAFYIGDNWSLNKVLAICLVNYGFKTVSALIFSPLLYLIQYFIDRYLGEELSSKMKLEALKD